MAEWQAFEELYGPIGVEARLDRTAAVIAQQIVNMIGRPKKPYSVEDFMPRWDARPLEGFEEEGGVDAGGAA
ncbi:phage tail assembly protein T [Planobispora siamensis]|uniref:phage tail assembly protein T n=1 Tax=Planobispora siamensis TaxID=936338 RepID=UPI00406BB135